MEITSKAKIAWLGAGTMGAPMAGNLARAGFNVAIWNRTNPCPGLEHAIAQGCTAATSIEEALRGSQVVCTCVTDGAALRSVLFATHPPLTDLLAANALVVDFSTIGPAEARAIARDLAGQSVKFLDAPVTGGDIGARAATLTFMAGADLEDLDAIRPLLNAMGKRVVHAGPVGSGQSLKLVNQLLCGVNLLAVVEALRAAETLGMDKSLVVEACGGGAAGSWQLVNLGPKIIANDYRPGFKAEHLLKDLRFLSEALANGSASGNPPCFAVALEAFERVVQAGQGASGTQAVATIHAQYQRLR